MSPARVADLVERINEAVRSETIDRAFGRLPTFLVTGVLMLFLLAFGRRYVLGMLSLFDDLERRQTVRRVLLLGARRGRTYILFTLAHSLVNGLIVGIACWLLDLPAPVSLGFAVGLMTAIPLIGTFVGGVPALLLAFGSSSWTGGRHGARPARRRLQAVEVLVVRPVVDSRSVRVGTTVAIVVVLVAFDLYGVGAAMCAVRPCGDRTRCSRRLWRESRRGARRVRRASVAIREARGPRRRRCRRRVAGRDGMCRRRAHSPVQAGQRDWVDGTGRGALGQLPTQTVTVQAIDNTFRPDRIEIAPGTEVVWVNRGRNDHDLMTDLGFGVTAAEFGPGDEYRHVFTEPGEYPYYCTIHGTPDVGMTGTVVVTDTA